MMFCQHYKVKVDILDQAYKILKSDLQQPVIFFTPSTTAIGSLIKHKVSKTGSD